jgi:hypothetical protein
VWVRVPPSALSELPNETIFLTSAKWFTKLDATTDTTTGRMKSYFVGLNPTASYREKSEVSAMPRGPKPEKPYRDFPLSPAANGQWCKKIRGQIHYFGVWAAPQAALDRYLSQRDDLHAGRTPRDRDGSTEVGELCNLFLAQMLEKSGADENSISPRTYADYRETCRKLPVSVAIGQCQP